MVKELSFMVTGQSIDLTVPARLVAGTVGEYTARFAFDADWDGYQRTAVFSCNTVEREQLLTDDACIVPWEVLIANGYLRVGVYGAKGDSRLPTVWTERRLFVNPGAGPTEEAAEPSPTLVEQLLTRMGDLTKLKTKDKSSLVAAINEIFSSGGGCGASVTDAAINEDGHLIITLSTGASIDAGYAVGPAGPAGQDGAPGKDGAAGAPGKDGVGIQAVEQTTTSTDDGGTNIITVTKSDGTSSTFRVRNGRKGGTGPAGADGAPGKDGLGVPAPTAEDAGKVPVVQEDGSYGLADRIAPPATAQVGQTIVVKTVDADGKPTEWEAADIPSGWELINEITTEEEVASVVISTDLHGNTFELLDAEASIIFPSGISSTILFYFYFAPGIENFFTSTLATQTSVINVKFNALSTTAVVVSNGAHNTWKTADAMRFNANVAITQFRFANWSGFNIPIGTKIQLIGRMA